MAARDDSNDEDGVLRTTARRRRTRTEPHRVVWDEENLAICEAGKSAKMKIDEPPTPYNHLYFSSGSEGEGDESSDGSTKSPKRRRDCPASPKHDPGGIKMFQFAQAVSAAQEARSKLAQPPGGESGGETPQSDPDPSSDIDPSAEQSFRPSSRAVTIQISAEGDLDEEEQDDRHDSPSSTTRHVKNRHKRLSFSDLSSSPCSPSTSTTFEASSLGDRPRAPDFEAKRKQHYNEWRFLKSLPQTEDDDDDEE